MRVSKQSRHVWKCLSYNQISHPDDPTYQCEKCGKTICHMDAILHKGWSEAKDGVCPGQPSSNGPQDFHLINVVAPHA